MAYVRGGEYSQGSEDGNGVFSTENLDLNGRIRNFAESLKIWDTKTEGQNLATRLRQLDNLYTIFANILNVHDAEGEEDIAGLESVIELRVKFLLTLKKELESQVEIDSLRIQLVEEELRRILDIIYETYHVDNELLKMFGFNDEILEWLWRE